MTTKFELLLAAAVDQQGSAERGVAELHDSLRVAALGTDVLIRALVHDPAFIGGLSHEEETEAAPGFCGLIEIAADDEAGVLAALAALPQSIAKQAWLDRARSSIVAGTEHIVVPGDEPVMLAMALTRKEGMSSEEFQRYWATKHAELGRQVPDSQGYRQVPADAQLTAEARSLTQLSGDEYDGVALAYYSDANAFHAIMANAAVVEPLLEDERRFIDHGRSTLVVGRAPRPDPCAKA